MQITGCSVAEFAHIVDLVSRERYENNLIIDNIEDQHGVRRPRMRVTLRTITGKGPDDTVAPGARMTWSGRRYPTACWHTVRDVLHVMFERHPDAMVTAGRQWRAKYDGMAGFLADYPSTGQVNIGSEYAPAYMPELCECDSTTRAEPLSLPPYVVTFPI